MPTKQFTQTISGGAVTISKTITRTADGVIDIEPTVNAAKAISDWVKSDANTAAGNLTAGHGWSTGQCDVYWTGGRRYDVAATISTYAVAFEGGSGDDFPASANTTVKMAMHQQINQMIDGDLLEIICICLNSTTNASTARGHLHAEDADGDVIADMDFDANEPRTFDVDAGDTNPFTGDIITTLFVTMDSTSETVTLQVSGLQDVTP